MKRTITSFVYLVVMVGFYALKLAVNLLWFDVIIVLFSLVGTYEICRAFGDRIGGVQKAVCMIFSTGTIVCYAVSDAVYAHLRETDSSVVNYSPNLAFVVFMAGITILVSLIVLRHEKTSLESLGAAFTAYLYPSVFLLVLSGVNHMPQYSEIGIMFVFVLGHCADCMAYVFGGAFGKKLPAKLAPNISPNKTLIGGFGGLIGGVMGAVAIYFIYFAWLEPSVLDPGSAFVFEWQNFVFFLALGVLTAVFSQFGDLVESGIKRKFGIKDMGNCLPGHGGVLDRIDSVLFSSLIVCFVIVMRIMIVG